MGFWTLLPGRLFVHTTVDATDVLPALLLLLGAFILASWVRKRPADLDLPLIDVGESADIRRALEKGAKDHPDEPYILPLGSGRLIILPPRLIDEIRLVPDSELSSKEHHFRYFLGRWSSVGTHAPELHHALALDLQRNLQKVLESARDEVHHAFAANLPSDCRDWTRVRLFPTLLSVSALIIERTWVGLPLSRDPGWIAATTGFVLGVGEAAAALGRWPAVLRSLVAPMLAEIRSLKRHRAAVERMVMPMIQAHLNGPCEENNNMKSKPAGGELFTWLARQYRGTATSELVARDILIATFSVYTITSTATQAFFDLAARPEYLDELREELASVLESDPTLAQKTSLRRLRKMDSFIRESQRMSPLGLTTMMRVVMHPDGLALSTGHVIPAGETIAGPNHAVNFNPETYPDPHTFDGFRFSRLRETPGNETRYQLSSTSTEHINFGHGINACPGRFFASTVIKVMLCHLIQNYDVSVREGRPANVYQGAVCLPDPGAEILLKARK